MRAPARRSVPGPSRWLVVICFAVLAAAATAVFLTSSDSNARLTNNLVAVIGAMVAAVLYARTGWSYTGPGRQWRMLMAAGLGGWAVANAIWAWYRIGPGAIDAVPGAVSALYVVFPACVLGALLVIARADYATLRMYETAEPLCVLLLDGLIVVASIIALTRELHALGQGPDSSAVTVLLRISYPVIDTVLIVIALLMAVGLRSLSRSRMVWLVLGLCAFGAGDLVYAYYTLTDVTPPALGGLSYLIGIFLLTPAALAPPRQGAPRRRSISLAMLVVPYVPLGVVLVVVVINVTGGSPYPEVIYVLSVIIALVVLRHISTLLLLHRSHQRLAAAILRDPLTGVANRVQLADLFDEALSSPRYEERGLIYVDLDDFKAVNDELGHHAGDELLRITAHRLRRCVRDDDTVARIGGDEFVIVLIPPPPDPGLLVRRLADAVAQPVALDGVTTPVRITASIGYHRIAPGQHPSDALTHADRAMYRDKRGRAD